VRRRITPETGFEKRDTGTVLIRPDFVGHKDFPFLWQQMEYVLGGGSSNYMFLVLAADKVLSSKLKIRGFPGFPFRR